MGKEYQMINLTEPQKELVSALRSGEYKQGKFYLEKDNKFCCLGVACKVAQKNGIKINCNEYGQLIGRTLRTQPEVVKYFNIDPAGNNFIDPNDNLPLFTLNDMMCNKSFSQIADILETVEGYFEANKAT